jgi:hypothetical protein
VRRSLFVLSIALLACAASVPAQSMLGAIAGRVTDGSGAAVPGATLTLRNVDENTMSEVSSTAEGLYEFLNLKSGRYQIAAEKSGFGPARTPEILLDARQTRRADFTLEVAPRTDTVVVTTSVPLINTDSGTISDSKSFEEITRLPLNYRASGNNSPLLTVFTVPGVQETGGRLSIGGGLPGQVEISLDGISVVYIGGNHQDYSMTPSPEILGEFRVTSVDNSAEFGQMADVAMVSRGGTNQVHGSAFWYHQNRALDATIYGAPSKQAKVFNTFGGSFSGPVDLPEVYRGRNRTFFFVDYEGTRRPQSQLDQLTVPTASMRTGNFNGVPGDAPIDPLNGAPFPGNQIPATRISSVARNLLGGYYPLPNAPTADSGVNYLHLTPTSDNQDGYDLRLDHVINSKQHLYGRWTVKSDTFLGDAAPLPSDTFNSSYKMLVLSHIFAFQPALSNEFRFGFTHAVYVDHFPILGRDAVANLGLVGLNLTNVQNSGGFPSFFPDDGSFTVIGYGRPTDNNSRIFQYADTLSWVRGRHAMKFGAELRHVGYRSTLHAGYNDDFGGFEFSSGGFSGNAFADLLLGLPAISSYAAVGPNLDESATNAAFFAQDSWRVHRRLTLQFGLRWEVHPPFQENSGNITNFDHQTGNVIIPDHAVAPAPTFLAAIGACPVTPVQPCTGVLTASQAGLPQGLRRTYYGDWGPRFGFAWQPSANGKTVIRGGIGGYTQSLLGWFAYAPTGIHSSDVRTYQNYQGPASPPLFAFPNVSPPLSDLGTIGIETFGTGVDPTFKDPRSWQWNFTIEHELPWSTAFRASYIGLQSGGMPVMVDYNQVPAGAVPFTPSRRPFPLWANLYSLEAIGFSNYQGMQLELSRRLRGDAFFQASYTLSKNLGEAGNVGRPLLPLEYPQSPVTDRFDTGYDRGNLPGSRRNRFLLTGLFPLPFGKGRMFGSHWHGLVQGGLGGWELSTVSLIQSGPFVTPTMPQGNDQSNTDAIDRGIYVRPDRIANGNRANPAGDQYWDKTAFVLVPKSAGRFGNAGVGILEGPGTVALSAGLAKTFRLTEKLRLRTEATFTNLPNHPNFNVPATMITNPQFGKLISVQGPENAGNRTGQLAARFDF